MLQSKPKRIMRKYIMWLGTICLFSGAIITPQKANACCVCTVTVSETLSVEWPRTISEIQARISAEMATMQTWYVQTLWEDTILPAMLLFADQMSAVAMNQTAIVGTLFDAKNQLETQRTLQKISARTHKDYHPSLGICTFGTAVKSLAASERKSEFAAHVMSQRFQDRMHGNANSAAAKGPAMDRPSRLNQYREHFCDPADQNAGLKQLCDDGAAVAERSNKDIDFTRTIDFPWTLDIDFTDTKLTNNEEEVLALSDNIYGHEVFTRIAGTSVSEGGLIPDNSKDQFTAIHQHYMDARAILAKLSVAQNSFNAITSMKASGTESSREFLAEILTQLGISGDINGLSNVDRMLGHNSGTPPSGQPSKDSIPPSYNAQMEVLTKKIYQNPDFYTNLYDKPANVERKKVAMQAIGLMQKFDLFKSYLRYEASLSVLLEMAVIDLQEKIELKTGDQAKTGEE